jgi:hypothetical protein
MPRPVLSGWRILDRATATSVARNYDPVPETRFATQTLGSAGILERRITHLSGYMVAE